MCELLGFSAREPEDIREQLREFYRHSTRHPHGWGIMTDKGLEHGPERAVDSERLRKIVDELEPHRTLLGHIRYATVGSIKKENCHPFTAVDRTGRRWTLIHNGTIYSSSQLVPYMRVQRGDTDSERLFLYLMDKVDDAQVHGELSAEERCFLIESLVAEVAPRNKLNLMLWDGELLYIHKNMEETMRYRRLGSGYIFATTPVDGGDWRTVPIAQLLAYRDGELVFKGQRHGGIFVPTLQYIRAMDAMNI